MDEILMSASIVQVYSIAVIILCRMCWGQYFLPLPVAKNFRKVKILISFLSTDIYFQLYHILFIESVV
jgi:hypothetical protein